MHPCVHSGVPGALELIRINKLLLFTPTDRALYATQQSIIRLKHVRTLTKQKNSLLCLETPEETLVFEFPDASSLDHCYDEIETVKKFLHDKEPTARRVNETKVLNLTRRKSTQTILYLLSSDKPAMEFRGKFLLTPALADSLQYSLPLELRYSNWQLLFSPKIHGISFPSFYRHFAAFPLPTVLVVTDSKRTELFGAFCKSPFQNSRKYYGSTENFIFKNEKMFPWTCANQLFQFSDDRRIVIGGGPSGSSIVLFDNWLRGSTSKCETFNPEEALLEEEEFVVGDVEFWVLTDSKDGLVKNNT